MKNKYSYIILLSIVCIISLHSYAYSHSNYKGNSKQTTKNYQDKNRSKSKKDILEHLYRSKDLAARLKDTVIYHNTIFTKYRKNNSYLDSNQFKIDLAEKKNIVKSLRDSLKAPDSLRITDPFRYRFYIALNDSLSHKLTRDSLLIAKDSLTAHRLDSIYYADSTLMAKAKFDKWYKSLSRAERKKYDFEQEMKLKQKQLDSLMKIKDKEQARKDSITEHTPRILSTFAIADSLQYKRIIQWTREPYFIDLNVGERDTSYNYYFNDSPMRRKDINASYLGTSGSASQMYDFFKRASKENISFYKNYEVYSYSPQTIAMINTKTPYTELAYWGNLLSSSQIEESNVHILTGQNITPEFNFTINYDRYGSRGLLNNEAIDNRTFYTNANYLGKKYLAHYGYIYNKIDQKENGGIVNSYWLKDTLVESREMPVKLNNAKSILKKHIFFIDQSYRIPFSFLKAKKDSIKNKADSIDNDITTAFIGHNSEYSYYRKIYTDQIGREEAARDFYKNTFNINPLRSYDSLSVIRFDNKIFLKLQPWSRDAIVSKLNIGLGNKLEAYYGSSDKSYFTKQTSTLWNSSYIYGGAKGQIKKYFNWSALASYTFLGKEVNDLHLNSNIQFNIYPFRRAKNSPISINGQFELNVDEPDYFEQYLYTNHYKWNNNFSKSYNSVLAASLDIPYWNLKIDMGYTILKNHIYYDADAIVRQHNPAVNVAKLALEYKFKIWQFHFDNKILAQASSNTEVVNVPSFATNLKWYLQFNIWSPNREFVAMQMQLGANIDYTSSWYAPAFNPVISQFYNQRSEKYGNSPYIDLFANMQWKRASIFVKLINVNMGWPIEPRDYFSAANYIRPSRILKVGIFWPFYIQAHRNSTMNNSSSNGNANPSRALRR